MDDDFFARMRQRLEPAYLATDEPWRQSGFSGPEARWVALREPVADCIDRAGSFLDVGCANGYFVECALGTAERGVAIDPRRHPPQILIRHCLLPRRPHAPHLRRS